MVGLQTLNLRILVRVQAPQQMKILLTGVAGTGKSSITRELNKRGIAAIDLHGVKGLLYWRDKKTKERVPYSPGRPPEWFQSVERLCDIDMLKQMLAEHEDIFMAGTAGGNEDEYYPLFDKVILLQCDPQTLIHRMETRTNTSGFGKTKSEQDGTIEWQKSFDPHALSRGAIPVNTFGDIDSVVDKILEIAQGWL